MANPKLTIIGDSKKAQDAVTALEKKVDRLENKLRRAGQTSEKSSKEMAGGLRGAGHAAKELVGQLTGIAGGVGGAIAAIVKLKGEFEDLRNRQKEAGQAQVGVAGAQRTAIRNLGNDPTMSVKQLTDLVNKTSRETGADPAALYGASSAILSSKGKDVSALAAHAALGPAARLNAGDRAGLVAEATGITALLTRVKPGTTAKDVAGYNIAVGQASNVVDPQMLNKNVIPAIARQRSFGDTFREGGALLSTLTQMINDTEGRVSSNAMTRFSQQLQQLTAHIPGLRTSEGGTTLKRLAFINSPEGDEIRKKLRGSLEEGRKKSTIAGEAKAFTTLDALLSPGDNKAKQVLASSLKAIPKISEGDVVYNRTLAALNTPEQRAAMDQRLGKSTAKRIRISDTVGGAAGIGRETLEENLKAIGVTQTGRFFEGMRFDIATEGGKVAPGQQVVKQLREHARFLSGPKIVPDPDAGFIGRSMGAVVRGEATAEEKRQSGELKALADKLEEQIKLQRQQLAEQRRARPVVNRNGEGMREPMLR